MIELSHKMKEEVKAMQSEIKQNIQGTKSEGKEGNQDPDQQFGAEGRNKHSTGTERKKFKKIRKVLGTSRTTLNIPKYES